MTTTNDFAAKIRVGSYDEHGNYGTFIEQQTVTIEFTEQQRYTDENGYNPIFTHAIVALHKEVLGVTIEELEVTLDDFEQDAEFSMVATPPPNTTFSDFKSIGMMVKPRMKLIDGVTTFEADAFETGMEVVYVTEDEQRVAVPVGEYQLEDRSVLVVAQEGIVAGVNVVLSSSDSVPVGLELRILSSKLSYGKLIRDIICRLIILQLFNLGMINLTWFWILQLFYQYCFFLPNMWSKRRKHEKLKRYVERKTHISDDSVLKNILLKTRLIPKRNPFIMLVFLMLIILGQVSAFSVLDILSVELRLEIMFIILLPMQIILANILIGVMTQVPIINEETDGLTEDDKNDVSIHKFSSTLLHMKQKIDTYTIESALLGALSLSAYLAILQNNLVNAASFKQCLQLLQQLNVAFFNLNFTKAYALFGELFKNDILWHLIVLEGIIASVLYFLLIVARKKTHDQMKELELNLEISKAFNTKEEELINLNLDGNNNKVLKRKKEVSKITNDHIKNAYRLLPVLENSIKYMDLLRYVATSTFILLICTSCCIVLPTLGISILIIYLLSEIILKVYPQFLKYLKTKKEPIKKTLLPFQEEGTWIWLKYFIYGFTAASVLVCIYGTLIPNPQIFKGFSFLLPAILIGYLLIAILLIVKNIFEKLPNDIIYRSLDLTQGVRVDAFIINKEKLIWINSYLFYFGLLFLILVGFGKYYKSFMTAFIYLSIFCFQWNIIAKYFVSEKKFLLQYTIQLFLFASLVMVYFNVSYAFFSTLMFSVVLLIMAVQFTTKKKNTNTDLDENKERLKLFPYDFVANPSHEFNVTFIAFILFYLVFLHF